MNDIIDRVEAELSHRADVEWAKKLVETNSTPEVANALTEIISARVPRLASDDVADVVKALTDPVAYAMSRSFDRGHRAGDHSRRQHVANQLGLGRLEQ